MAKLSYLASPYSHQDEHVRETNFSKVSAIAASLCASGEVVISPITYGHTLLTFRQMPSDWPFWQHFCLALLEKCDELIVAQMRGWEFSRGVAEEIKFAESNGIPIRWLRVYDQPLDPKLNDGVYTVTEWQESVANGYFTNFDGNGYWVRDGLRSSSEVFSSEPEDATHVVWYNK